MSVHYSIKPTKIRQRVRAVTLLLALAIAVQGLFLLPAQQTNAAGVSWSGGSPTAVSVAPDVQPTHCRTALQTQVVAGVFGQKSMCIMGQNEKMRVGSYSDATFAYAVGFGLDAKMYRALLPCGGPRDCLYMPATDTLVTKQYLVNGYVKGMVLYKNLSSRLHSTLNPATLTLEYTFDSSNPDLIFQSSDGYAWPVNGIAASDNGKWVVVEAIERGIALLNVETLAMKRVATHSLSYGTGMNPSTEMAVSNDGEHIAIGGGNAYLTVFDTPPTCGDASNDDHWNGVPMAIDKRCAAAVINFDSFINRFRDGYAPTFNYDGGELTFYASSYVTGVPIQKITLRAAGYAPLELDYLAMGDSYSSGEGDLATNPLTNKKYYRNFTNSTKSLQQNVPQEKCHISTRSYPYSLARSMNLALDEPKQWDSIACSGATAWDVKGQASENYQGQGDRLKDFSNVTFKAQALNDFIPGRQKQIEFVKKYKPKVITLTMGGNDIGFGEKLIQCVRLFDTCRHALGDGRASLADQIIDQYDNLSSLYKEIYTASGSQAKIYVLSYPQFINGNADVSCPLDIGMLDADERQMIKNSVTYLNRVIKKAADAAGVKYIDIENSLDGHRLCDNGETYVTGVAYGFGSDPEESFHPNAKGNAAMAVSIWDENNVNGESLLDYGICPTPNTNTCPDSSASKDSIATPSYFETDLSVNSRYYEMSPRQNIRGTFIRILTGLYSLAPGSTAKITLHSESVDLGPHTISNNGQIDINALIPVNTPVGYHTLILTGSTYSGEQIQLEQVVLIQGSDPNDIDDNNIPDNQQACLFMASSGIDADFDGIDDVCDPEIGKISTISSNISTLNNSRADQALDAEGDEYNVEGDRISYQVNPFPPLKMPPNNMNTSRKFPEFNLFYLGAFTTLSILITIVVLVFKKQNNSKH